MTKCTITEANPDGHHYWTQDGPHTVICDECSTIGTIHEDGHTEDCNHALTIPGVPCKERVE